MSPHMTSEGIIKKLPPHLIDQIKAGEVIESPAALLKELIENAIDAQATKIDIELKDNGISLIKIKDNGHGINYDDLPLAFERHATSKIVSFDDLYRLHSYGFRGEALASAASISRISCTSATNASGGKIELEGACIKNLSPLALSSTGTSITIRDLFYNTPARMKFIRTEKKEHKAIMRIFLAYALAHPEITFSLQQDGQTAKYYPAIETTQDALIQRCCQLFSWLTPKDLVSFEQVYNGQCIKGLITHTSSKSRTKKINLLLANNRLFTEQSFHYLITQLGKKVWNEGEQGSYIIQFIVPENQIDVNVHPAKTRIKFEKHADIYALLSASIKEVLKPYIKAPAIKAAHPMDEQSPNLSHQEILNNQPLATNTTAPNAILQHIITGVSLLTIENHAYLLQEAKLFMYLLHHKLPATEAVPLLITPSITFTKPLSSVLHRFLQQNKFALIHLEATTYLLQSVPQFLANTPIASLLSELSLHESNLEINWNNLLPLEYDYNPIFQQLDHQMIIKIALQHQQQWFKIKPQQL